MDLLRPVIKEKDNGMLLHSPTNDIKECCSQSALQCFKNGLSTIIHKNTPKMNILMKKLHRNLSKLTNMNSMNTCTEQEIKNVMCMPCDSYPTVNSKEFLTNLQSHLQKAYTLQLQKA
ncbi:interleukin-21 [Neoarius graeffei]|uniref:interleukin-21 n=1 Tax=Neoarius graeffei TaxID=443677 RepID=UPI00298C61C9|nr:interleukin-21 [Neoarius graeffei]